MLSKTVIILLVIPLTIFAKTIRINEDPKLDYDFHDEGSADTTKPPIVSTTIKTNGIEIEENIIDSGLSVSAQNNQTNDERPIFAEPVTSETNSLKTMCSLDSNQFDKKIKNLLEKFVPDQLKLQPITKGTFIKLFLQNGILNINKDYKIMGQPLCTEIDEKKKKYDIMLSFNDLMGSYEWKVYNLFGYNFSESAIIKIKEITTELVIVENSNQRTKLQDLEVGKINGIVVNVNIPEQLPSINIFKSMIEYIVSKMSTMIANGSIDTIMRNIRDIFIESIEQKIKINP